MFWVWLWVWAWMREREREREREMVSLVKLIERSLETETPFSLTHLILPFSLSLSLSYTMSLTYISRVRATLFFVSKVKFKYEIFSNRMLYVTICLFTNASCEWRTWKEPFGRSTRWSITEGDLKEEPEPGTVNHLCPSLKQQIATKDLKFTDLYELSSLGIA